MLSIFDEFGDQKKLQTTQKTTKNPTIGIYCCFSKTFSFLQFSFLFFLRVIFRSKAVEKHIFNNLKHFSMTFNQKTYYLFQPQKTSSKSLWLDFLLSFWVVWSFVCSPKSSKMLNIVKNYFFHCIWSKSVQKKGSWSMKTKIVKKIWKKKNSFFSQKQQ